MASRIAGITVEIGGDTTKLSKALESVNKTIKTTQSELKDVNKLLKLDPSNTETVTQKQRMLKDAIEATKEKLTTLKTAAEQANQQLADGKITQEQYDALQREIVETEQNLKSLQEQAAVTNATLAKIDAVGEKLQTVGSQVEETGKKFLPVTAAVTGLGTAAVKTAADFDQEMSKVAAISARLALTLIPCVKKPARWVPRPSSLPPRQPPLWNTWRWPAGRPGISINSVVPLKTVTALRRAWRKPCRTI